MKKIITICTTLLVALASFATDYTIEPGGTSVASFALPTYNSSSYTASSFYGSITQQIYLATELTSQGALSGNITALTFYYTSKNESSTAEALTRNIAIYLMESDESEFEIEQFDRSSGYGYDFVSYFLHNSKKVGTKVYDGPLTTREITSPENDEVELIFSTPFAWNGSKNIVMTVVDKTGGATTHSTTNLRFYISSTQTGTPSVSHPRFAYVHWMSSSDPIASWITDGNYDFSNKKCEEYGNPQNYHSIASQQSQRSYVNKVTFSISTTIPAPTNLSASSITTSSATLTWNAAAGATGYNVRWGKISGSLDHSQSNVAGTSLPISDLEDGETYYFDVQTITAGGTSAYASEANFETAAITHEHDGITFSKWSSTTSMPTSGNYYLVNNVEYEFYEGGYLDLAGDLNLCLNGHTINLGTKSINVTNSKTMKIFDPIGGGKITGLVAGQDGVYTYKGVISVENNGTLVLRAGEIENTKPSDDTEYKSIAIASGGTLIISGEPIISGNDMDIFLVNNNVITIEAGKPLTNTAPYSVASNLLGTFTSGWANMSGADPRDYFESASASNSVCLKNGEAALRTLLHLDEAANNSVIGSYSGQVVDVELTRSTLYSAYYNTICLPFALSNAQLEEYFGAGYDLEEFVSSELDGDLLNLTFERKYALEAGKPYLLQPSMDVTNPTFEAVTIGATSPVDITTTEVYFHGTYRPTELTGGNQNILFLYPDNELRWPAATESLKGFRAYFEIIGETSAAARRARIVTPSGTPTAVEAVVDSQASNRKWLKDGQIIIERNGRYYNITGQRIH